MLYKYKLQEAHLIWKMQEETTSTNDILCGKLPSKLDVLLGVELHPKKFWEIFWKEHLYEKLLEGVIDGDGLTWRAYA